MTEANVTLSEAAGIRNLHLGTPWIQGSMNIKKPYTIELEYVQRMMAWLLFASDAELKERSALQLGLGAATITKYCHHILRMNTTAIEINPKVIAICQQGFYLPAKAEGLEVVLGDASKQIKNPRWIGSVDALAVDLYDHDAAAPVLDSQVFYSDCRAVLTDGGVMTVNLFGRNSSYAKSVAKITATFGEGCVWAFPATREGNTVVLAFRNVPRVDPDVLASRADSIETKWALPAKKWLKTLKPIPSNFFNTTL